MNEEDPVPKDPKLSPYFEAGERAKATKKAAAERKIRGGKNSRKAPETEHIAPTDDQLRESLSTPPDFETRMRIKDDADVLNRTHSESAAPQNEEDWEKVSEIINQECA